MIEFNLPQFALIVVAIVLAITVSPWWLLLLTIHIPNPAA